MDPRVHQTELCNVNLGFSLTDLSLLPVVFFYYQMVGNNKKME